MLNSRSKSMRLRISFLLQEGRMHVQWRSRRAEMWSSSRFDALGTFTHFASLIPRRLTSWSNPFPQVLIWLFQLSMINYYLCELLIHWEFGCIKLHILFRISFSYQFVGFIFVGWFWPIFHSSFCRFECSGSVKSWVVSWLLLIVIEFYLWYFLFSFEFLETSIFSVRDFGFRWYANYGEFLTKSWWSFLELLPVVSTQLFQFVLLFTSSFFFFLANSILRCLFYFENLLFYSWHLSNKGQLV